MIVIRRIIRVNSRIIIEGYWEDETRYGGYNDFFNCINMRNVINLTIISMRNEIDIQQIENAIINTEVIATHDYVDGTRINVCRTPRNIEVMII